ncbi:hypothetical protein lerEdw1_016583 [Lerista edwardsae]|nr:hypothetical protein lerEdw1_016583 [Lerista edwardsae]
MSSVSMYRGNCRPIRFEPPMLDFHEQPVGMPKMEKVYLHNPSSEETIILVSISATTSHFHASFFQNRKILPGGNTSFDVVFLARMVGNVENTLFINTSNHGVFTYQVFGVGVPNPYRLRPFIGAKVPVNSSFSPIINIHNPHSEPLQVIEMYSSGGDLHLELPTGQQGGTRKLWEIPPYETKGVMRASFSSREADNYTAFIRIKTNASDNTEFIILPVEVEVTTAPGIYSSTEMLDFGTLRTQDLPKMLNLHLLNSGTKDVPITTFSELWNLVLDPHHKMKLSQYISNQSRYELLKVNIQKLQVLVLMHQKQNDPPQFSGKITVKAKEKSYSKLEIPYQAEVLDGYLGFDHAATLFHLRDSPADSVERPIYLTNTFSFAVLIHDISLPEEIKTIFKVHNFSKPVLIPPNESRYIFTLYFVASLSSLHIDNNILLITNASKFHLPVRVYTGFLDYFILPLKPEERIIDFGILSAAETSSIMFAIINSNPIQLAIKSWHVIGDGLTIELLAVEKGNRTTIIASLPDLGKARALDQASILTIPVKAVIAVGSLTCSPKHILLPPSFPGKTVHQSLSIMSSFSQKVKIQQIRSLSEDVRFYYKRLRSNKEDLEPGKKSKRTLIFSLELLFRLSAVFEVDTDLQKAVTSKITAELAWPSLLGSSRHLDFSLTNTNSSSEEEILLENPADVPVFVQFLPIALYSNPSGFIDKLIDRFNLSKPTNFNLRTLEFQVSRNCGQALQSSTGFAEGMSRQLVLNVILKPGEKKSVTVKFTPVLNKTVSSVIIVRNNLTVIDAIMVKGQGTTESMRVAGKPPGPGSSLRFKITEVLLKDCTEKTKLKEPNFTLKRTFRVENTGQLQVNIKSMEISGYLCEGYGFKVLNCQEFALNANASTDIVILFTPDFTTSRVIRELKLTTAGGSEFIFILNASLPYHMLATCAEALPRPNWELALYVIVSGIMSVLFLLLHFTEYLSCESFKSIYSASSLNALGPDSNHNSSRGIYGPGSSSSRSSAGNHKQCNSTANLHSNRNSVEVENVKQFKNSTNIASRTSVQAGSAQSANRTSSLFMDSTAAAQNHAAGRKSRGTKQSQQSHQQHAPVLLEQNLSLPPRVPQPQEQQTENPLPHSQLPSPSHLDCASNTRHSSEDSDIAALIETMDKDFDHPESPSPDVFTEQPPSPVAKNKGKGKPFQRKSKPQKKREEKERRGKGKQQEDELKDSLADDDSSSTTTEASNPDTETLPKEDLSDIRKHSEQSTCRNYADSHFCYTLLPRVERMGLPYGEILQLGHMQEAEAYASTKLWMLFTKMPKEWVLDKEPEKQKGKQPILEKQENVKQKSKKLTKKEIPADVKSSSFEMPCPLSLENKQHKSFSSKLSAQHTFTNGFKPRNLQKTKGLNTKLMDSRPPSLAKFFSSGSGHEPGNTSSSEGEKDSPPPEWDLVPIHKAGNSTDNLYKLSLQTLSADAFLKQRQTSPTPASPSPPPAALAFVPRSTYSSIVNNCNEPKSKLLSGAKHKVAKAASLPGRNGNPTFAAVAAGYDKSPGGSGLVKSSPIKTEASGCVSVVHPAVDSDGSDSSGLWSPISNPSSPDFTPLNSFSAFGNSFNLTGEVFSKLGQSQSVYGQEVQRNWSEFSNVPSSIWDSSATDLMSSWPSSSNSPTHTTSSILGNPSGLWSTTTTPFSSSIWSSNLNNTLPFNTSANTLPGIDLGSENPPQAPAAATPAVSSPEDMGQTYNPWRIWSPAIGRRSSDPWSNVHYPPEK